MTKLLSFADLWDRVAYAPSVLVAVNCDGALSETLRLNGPLRRIAASPQATVAVLSTKPVDELRASVNLDAILIGRQGLEVQFDSGRFVHPQADEFAPPAWDKASALKYVQRQLSLEDALVICVGDHETDEAMFRAFRRSSISVRVGGAHNSAASYSVADASFATELLHWIADTLGSGTRHPLLLRGGRMPKLPRSESCVC